MPLDPDALLVLDMIRLAGRPPFETLTPDEARTAYSNSRKVLQPPAEDVAEVRDLAAPGPAGDIRLRVYRGTGTAPDKKTSSHDLLSWRRLVARPDLESHDGVCRRFANLARCCVVSVDYRMAPEHQFSACVDDCAAATRWAVTQADTLRIDADRSPSGAIPPVAIWPR